MLTTEDMAEIRRIVREEVSAVAKGRPRAVAQEDALEAALAEAIGDQEIRTHTLVGRVLASPALAAHVVRRLAGRDITPQLLGTVLSHLRRRPGSRLQRRHSGGALWYVVAPATTTP